MAGFPAAQPGVLYLTEGGQETELMYKHGHELPEFAELADKYGLTYGTPAWMDDIVQRYGLNRPSH